MDNTSAHCKDTQCVSDHMTTALLSWCFCCRHAPAHAHSRAQRGRAPSAALRLRLHSSTRLRPATTAQLRLWHVNDLNTPHLDLPQHLPSSVLLFVFLTSFLWSSTDNRGHKQATAHSRFEYSFFINLSCYKRKRINASKGLLFPWFEKKLDHVCFLFHIPYL